ncbi:MAG TPA: hypothetical protein VE173_15620 [Longimicrobiales bacterium]|nr:hypothetical protein [Longimicrobiales bacterium]
MCRPRPHLVLVGLVGLVGLGALATARACEGQAPLALEVQGGASIPVGPFTRGPRLEGSLDAAPAFGLYFTLRRNRWVGLYAGFSQLRFGCRDDGCTAGGALVSTAWEVGGHLRTSPGPWGPWIRLGLVLTRVESDYPAFAADGVGAASTHQVSDLGVGGELGVGWRIGLTDGVGVNPGVRYAQLDSRLDRDAVLRMRYWVVDLGVVLGF